jgi:hypothetical protein
MTGVGEVEPKTVEKLRDAELARIADPAVRRALEEHLVPPRAVQIEWEYGDPGEHYVAFIVAEFSATGMGIAYSRHGFGPEHPWGVISLERLWSEMDANWFRSLEAAFRSSGACPVPRPRGYEVD